MRVVSALKPVGLPLGLFLVLSVSSAAVWWAVQSGRESQMTLESELVSSQVEQRLESWFATREAMVSQLAQSWTTQFAGRPDQYRQRVEQLLGAFDGFQAVNYMSPQGVIEIVVPEEGNEAALGMDLTQSSYESVQRALGRGLSGTTARTDSTIDLLQGGKGFASYFPIVDESGEVLGAVNGVFRIDDAMNSFLDDEALQGRFRIQLKEADSGVVVYGPSDAAVDWPYASECAVPVIDRPMKLTLAPAPSLLAERFDALPSVVLAAALFTYFCLTVLLAGFLRKSAENAEKEEARRAIERERAKIATIIDVAADFVGMVDENIRVVYLNQAGRKLLGIGLDEDLGGKVPEDFHPPEVAEFIQHEAIPEAARNGVWRGETDFVARDGTIIPASQTIVCHTDEQGKVHGFSTIARDIREQRAAEEERLGFELRLLHGQKLESLGILAGGIAHDFNNILMGIMGAVSLAREDAAPGSKVARFLDTIENSSLRAADICRQMLAYAGRAPFDKKTIDLKPMVEQIVDLLRASIPKSHEIRVDAPSEPLAVSGDGSQLSQVVLNLIKNASDAMGGKAGTIEVRLWRERFAEEELAGGEFEEGLTPGTYVGLEVRDQGCGMSPETQSRIFDPFFSNRTPGHGLGLAAVLGIVRTHGGGIFVESKGEGLGSRFRVVLPASTESVVPRAVPADSSGATGAGERVLLADDEATIVELVEALLTRAGYRVSTATNGEEAWEEYRRLSEEIRILVLDVNMPKLGGLEVLARVRGMDPTVPVVVTSGYASETEGLDQYSDPNTHFLHKPYRPAELLKLLSTVCPDHDDTAVHEGGSRREV